MEVRRQQKITHLFGKQPAQNDPEAEERIKELLEDNKKLRKMLMEKEAYVFQLHRSLLPQPRPFLAKHQAAINSEISSSGGEVLMRSKLAKQKDRLETYLRLFGKQVKTYTNERCVVMYNVHVKGKLVAQYAIQFTKPASGQDWSISKYHLPIGLCLETLAQYQPMSLDYLRQLQVALVAYHDRQDQIAKLKEGVPSHVYVNHNMSGMSVELVFPMIDKEGSGKPVKTSVELKYDAFEHRPEQLKIVQNLVTAYSEEFEAALFSQFEIMKYESLPVAFERACSKYGENNFYCPTDDDVEKLEDRFQEQDFAERVYQRNEPVMERRVNSADSDEEITVPQTKKSHKKQTKQQTTVKQSKTQQHNGRSTYARNNEESETLSDNDESVSFNTLRRQMKEMKQKVNEEAFKKPSAPKSGSKRAATRTEIEKYDDEDDTDSYVSDILKDSNKKKQLDTSNTRMSTYQVTDSDLTTGSYVFVPESKKKGKKITAKNTKANDSVGKENGKKKAAAVKSKSKK